MGRFEETKEAVSDAMAKYVLPVIFLIPVVCVLFVIGGQVAPVIFDGGFGSSGEDVDGNYPEPMEPVESDFEPPAPEPVIPEHVVGEWKCYWSPTMNENWHDDVLCSNGVDKDRPLLLTDWGFVTQADMMTEAQYYENYLNGG